MLVEGLKILVVSADGRDVVLDILAPGALVGEWSVIDGKPRSATVSALTDVEVLCVPAPAFRDFLDRPPDVRSSLMVDMIGRLRSQVRSHLEIGTGDAMGRVCARLVQLAGRYGQPSGRSVIVRSRSARPTSPPGLACPARPSSRRCAGRGTADATPGLCLQPSANPPAAGTGPHLGSSPGTSTRSQP